MIALLFPGARVLHCNRTPIDSGAPPDVVRRYSLMRAAALRGFRFPPMNFDIARARGQLNAFQFRKGESLATRYAADPASIPVP
jgi:hypothetical protein